MFEVRLQDTDGRYVPGQTLSVQLSWSLERTPKWLEVRLEWSTEGKGTTDTEIDQSHRWTELSPQGNLEWSCVVPRGPLSLQGSLIAIRWQLTAHLQGEKEVRRPIVITHGSSPVRLRAVAK